MRKANKTQTGKNERNDVPEIRKGYEGSDINSDHCRGEKVTEILTKSLQTSKHREIHQYFFFIVVPCILITSRFFSPTNAPFY